MTEGVIVDGVPVAAEGSEVTGEAAAPAEQTTDTPPTPDDT